MHTEPRFNSHGIHLRLKNIPVAGVYRRKHPFQSSAKQVFRTMVTIELVGRALARHVGLKADLQIHDYLLPVRPKDQYPVGQ